MSIVAICPSCAYGNHTGHKERIGGPRDQRAQICTCMGDCAEKYAAREEAKMRLLEQERQNAITNATTLLRNNGHIVIPPITDNKVEVSVP